MPITRTRTLYISPEDDAYDALLETARGATASLHLLVYGFTSAELGDILIAHHQAGRAVGVVADRTQSAGPTQRALLQRLVDAGVPVTITTSSDHGAIMHEKVLLRDAALGADHTASMAAYGSFNFSGHGADTGAQAQANHLNVDNDATVVALFWRQYQDMAAFGQAHPAWQLAPTGAADAPG